MKLHHSLVRTDDRPLVLAIGFFDGFHRGHQAIIRQTLLLRRPGFRAAALTFSNHPASLLRPQMQPRLITTSEERVNLLGAAGIEECFFVPFNAALARLSPQEFIDSVLVEKLRVRSVIVGENFRFGADRAGDVHFARDRLEMHSVQFCAVPNELDSDERISSSRVRSLIERGDLVGADRLLVDSYTLRGSVAIGVGRGHELGFPTANLAVRPDKALPKDGVYAATARHDGRDYAALVSLGSNPTFAAAHRTVEAWLRDFHRPIYGEEVALRSFRFIREQRKFDDVAGLVVQMERDALEVPYPSFV
ncbi:MAG: riboflavin biosynthesis protein RibF [Candidatus Eremiobacteraeota bacterium]|nr:riboflavin biosynthesis protein RibF [Candidatus Eremiobacteraeota bacterium]